MLPPSLNCTCVSEPPGLPAPPPPDELIVIVSVDVSVVIVMFVPAASVNVSVVESATTFVCPATAIVLNKFCDPPPPPV